MQLKSAFTAAALGLVALDIVFNNGNGTSWVVQHTISGLSHVCHAAINGLSNAAHSWGLGDNAVGHHLRPH
jgi:hypothetical protein